MSVQTVDEIALKIKVQDDGSWVVENLTEKIKKSTQNIGQSFNTANKTMVSWMKNIAKATGIFAGFYGVIRGGVNAIKGLITDTENFDTELTQVATLVDTTTVDIDAMSDSLFEMAGAMGSVGELTQGTYMEISSSVPAKNALHELTEAAKFAAGGQAELRDSVNLGTTVLNTYGQAAGGTAHVFDVLWQVIKDGKTTARELAAYMGQGIPIWKEAGMSFEEAGASLAVMTQISGNTSISVTALRGILSEVIKPSQEAAKEAERIGANFSVAAIKSMGFENWLRHLLDAIQKNNGDMATLFGRVEALNGIYQLTRNNLQNFSEEMQKMSKVANNNQEAYEKYLDSFKGSYNEVKNKLQALFIQVILPLMKEFAKWLRENSDTILSFVRNAVDGFRTIIGFIAQFKDVIIMAGKAWLTYFAINKINAVFKAFMAGGGVINQVVAGFVNLKKYGLSSMDALKGSFKTATGEAFNFATAINKIPPSVKISVALVGAELVGRALALLFDEISKFHDREMAQIIDATSKYEGEVSKLTRSINDFRQAGAEYEKTFLEIKKRADSFADSSDTLLTKQMRIWNAIQGTQAWVKYTNDLKNAGAGVDKLSISLVENQQVFKDLAKTIGNYTQVELDSLIKQGIITTEQKARLLELQGQYKENQKVIEEQRKAVDDLAKSMGILTKQGYEEQSQTIKDLLSLYPQYKTQITANEDTLKKWVDKITELSKTALPEEIKALEQVREELVLGYGEYNKQIVSVEEYHNEINKALSSLFPFTAAVYDNKEALYAQSLIMVGIATNNLPMLMQAWEMMGLKMSSIGENFQDTANQGNELSNTITGLKDCTNNAFGILDSLGIELGEVGTAFQNLQNAGQAFLMSYATGDIVGMITNGVKALVSQLQLAKSIFETIFGKSDGVGEAINRERQNISISETMEEIIRKTEEAIGDTHAAISLHFKEIVQEAEITINNIANYWQRARDILADLDDGNLTAKEAAAAVGESFNALLSEAQRLGTEGSKEMLALIGDVRNRGLEVAEITEYVNNKLMENVKAISTYISTFADISGITSEIQALNNEIAAGNLTNKEAAEIQQQIIEKQNELAEATQDVAANWDFLQASTMSTFHALETQGFSFIEICKMMDSELNWIADTAKQTGLEVSEGLQAMTNMATFIQQHEELAKRIEATRTLMEGLGDTDFLKETDFNMFLTQTKSQYEEIIALTGDEEMALRIISPILQDIIKYSDSYGFSIDEDTEKLINLARENKVLGEEEKSHYEVTNELLLAIAEALGAKIPEGLRRLVGDVDAAMGNIRNQTTLWDDSLEDIQDQFGEIKDSITSLDTHYQHHMTGASIVTETYKWKNALNEVAKEFDTELPESIAHLDEKYTGIILAMAETTQNTWLSLLEKVITKLEDDLPEETANLKAQYAYTMMEMQQNTEYWQSALADIEAQMAAATEEEIPYLMQQYSDAMLNMEMDTNNYMETLINLAEQIGIVIPDTLQTMQDKYQYVMSEMNLSTEGLILNFRELLELYGSLEFGGIGSNYGVYTQEEKEAMTAEYITMQNLWQTNWQTIVQDEDNMRRFLSDLQSLQGGILDEFTREYGSFLDLIRTELAKVQAGYYQSGGQMNPGFSTGGWFLVPPGYPEDSYQLPLNTLNVESGELIRIYTRQETQRIMQQGFDPYFSKETYASIPGIPGNISQDFYTLPDLQSNRKSKFNDGIAPLFTPGNTTTINDIKVGISTPKIDINVKQEKDIDKDTLEQIILELVDDEYRGFGNRLAEKLEQRLDR